MPGQPPTIYVIAGCNGAGKTTFAKEFLPKAFTADAERWRSSGRALTAHAGGRVPSPPRDVRAGKRLGGKTYIRLFRRARQLGYEIELHYLWLSSPTQAIARVRQRVKQGGHHVPAADIRRRFQRSLVHLVDDYLPLATRWAVWDSRTLPATRLAISSVDAIESVRHFIET